METKNSRQVAWAVLLVSISQLAFYTGSAFSFNAIIWMLDFYVLYVLYRSWQKTFASNDNRNALPVKIYLAWMFCCIVRGCFVAENYWEWKNLVGTSFALLLPVTVFAINSAEVLQAIVIKWFRYGLIIFLLIFPYLAHEDATGRFLAPFVFLLLALPIIPERWRILAFAIAALVVFTSIDARSNVIKFATALSFGLLYMFRLPFFFFRSLRVTLLCTPFVLLYLGTSGVYNIFQVQDNYDVDVRQSQSNGKDINLLADTRTLLYEEAIHSAIKNNYIVLGRTPARGNDSQLFGDQIKEELHTDKSERFSNEVAILNVFTWTGCVGVILYFLIFATASWLALVNSNSHFVKTIGVYISFRWAYAWVEDFTNFDISYLFLWIMIGICFSGEMRSMTDREWKEWFYLAFASKRKRRTFLVEQYLAE